ncbi:MAG: T9SS type A sorting domain-containing protein [Chitinophagales bacterium]|nr:T9SS type A sorting domain-containing protein [Chitinophagales bacterium]
MKNIYSLIILIPLSVALFAGSFPEITGEENGDNTTSAAFTSYLADQDINIYPNPVKNFATIGYTVGVDRIVIMNIVGKEVMSILPAADSDETRVNLTDLQPGVYFIAAYSNGVKIITKRFMKEQ